MNAEKPLGRYDSVDRAVDQNGKEVFIGNVDANGRQTVLSPDQILKSQGYLPSAERAAFNEGWPEEAKTPPEATKIQVTDASQVVEDTTGQAAAPVEVVPAAEPPPVLETIATTTAPMASETAVAEPESVNGDLEKRLGELVEMMKGLATQLTELVNMQKQLLEQNQQLMEKLTGKAKYDMENPEDREKMEASMIGTDSEDEEKDDTEDAGAPPPAEAGEQPKSRMRALGNWLRHPVHGTFAWINTRGVGRDKEGKPIVPAAVIDDKEHLTDKERKKRCLWPVLGAAALGLGAGYLVSKYGVPFIGGGEGGEGKEALQGVDLSGIDPNTIDAKTPEQFHQGVVSLLEQQDLHLNGGPLTPQEMSHMNEWMQAHGGIASGMEATPSGLEQHITNMPDLGEHFSNAQASAEQGFPVGESGTGRENLYGYVRELEKLGRTFARG